MTVPAITISESSIYYYIFFVVFTTIIISYSLRYSSPFATHIIIIFKVINAPISHSAIATTFPASLTASTSSACAKTSLLY